MYLLICDLTLNLATRLQQRWLSHGIAPLCSHIIQVICPERRYRRYFLMTLWCWMRLCRGVEVLLTYDRWCGSGTMMVTIDFLERNSKIWMVNIDLVSSVTSRMMQVSSKELSTTKNPSTIARTPNVQIPDIPSSLAFDYAGECATSGQCISFEVWT